MSQANQNPVAVRHLAPLKKAVPVTADKSVKSDLSVVEFAVGHDQLKQLFDNARIEQQNNAACRALIDANERLCNQILELASMVEFKSSQHRTEDAAASQPAVVHEPAVSVPASETVGSRLRNFCRQHSSYKYMKAKDEMMQAILRNHKKFAQNSFWILCK